MSVNDKVSQVLQMMNMLKDASKTAAQDQLLPQLKKMGLVTSDDLQILENRIATLEAQVQELTKPQS
jgi:hypothetical protein